MTVQSFTLMIASLITVALVVTGAGSAIGGLSVLV